MANVFDYLEWRGDLTFTQSPFNMVDNLILSCLAYVALDSVVGNLECADAVTVAEAAALFVQLPEDMKNLRVPEDETLLINMGNSRRFGNLQLFYAVQQSSREEEKQFAAITVALGDGNYYVAYRGTDFSVTGWKEDFNMTFRTGVPAQLEAVTYLQQVAQKTTGLLYIGGHSKGGNLAAFAAAFVEPVIQDRIVAVYNNDGPGFLEEVIQSQGYQAVYAKIRTFIPQTSLFGMMLEHAERFTIIQSSQHFIMQHDPYSWNVLGPDFIYLEEITASGRFLDQTIRGWLTSLTPEQREKFVDAMYEVIAVEEAGTVQELAKIWITNASGMLKSLRDVDEETANMMRYTLKLFIQNIGRSAQTVIFSGPATKILPLKEKLEQSAEHTWLKLPQFFQKIEKPSFHHVIGRKK